MIDHPNEFEIKALNAALSGEEFWLEELRSQIYALRVMKREYTNVGGYTDFIISEVVKPAVIPNNAKSYPPIARIEHPMLIHGGVAIVWTTNGFITLLELNADGDGVWPTGKEMRLGDFRFK